MAVAYPQHVHDTWPAVANRFEKNTSWVAEHGPAEICLAFQVLLPRAVEGCPKLVGGSKTYKAS